MDIENPVYIQEKVITETFTNKNGKPYTLSRDSTYYKPGKTNIYEAYCLFTVDKSNKIVDWSYEKPCKR